MKRFSLTLIFCAASAFAGEWAGTISDAKCGAAHEDASPKSTACVKGCVKGGQKPVFVTGGKVIKIANPEKVTDAFLGAKVKVTGELKGEELTIASIAAN